MTLLAIESLNAGYETGQVLFDIDLQVEAGEIVSLLGRNGAGKTTLLRSVIGATPPYVSSGTIRYGDVDVTGLPPYERVQIGLSIVPEDRRVWPDLTIDENIRLAINQASDPKDREDIFEWFPVLEEMRAKKARHMSGGEQQMLAIARALAANPDMILMDEPSEGLAPQIVQNVAFAIEEIKEEGVAILLVEQNIHMALHVSDTHYVIDQGEIVKRTDSQEIKENEELRQQYLSI